MSQNTPPASASRHTPEATRQLIGDTYYWVEPNGDVRDACNFKFEPEPEIWSVWKTNNPTLFHVVIRELGALVIIAENLSEKTATQICDEHNALAGLNPSAVADAVKALELLLCGAERAQAQGLNQPQVNGGVALARAALSAMKGGAK
jgi:hypothetical protein